MKNGNEKKKKTEKDEFDFFKLSADDDGNRDRTPNSRFPFWLIILCVILVLGFVRAFSSGTNDALV